MPLDSHLASHLMEQSVRAQKSHLWNLKPFARMLEKSIAHTDWRHKNSVIVCPRFDGQLPAFHFQVWCGCVPLITELAIL